MNGTTSNVSSPSGQSTPVPPPDIDGNDSRNGSTSFSVHRTPGSPLLQRRQNTGSSSIDAELSPKSLVTTNGNIENPVDRHGRKREIKAENEPLFENTGVDEDGRSNSVVRISEAVHDLK